MAKYIVEVFKDKTEWYDFESGELHRLDGPAVEYADGGKFYWINGKRHRLDGPAVEYADGLKRYYVDGKRHRVDGPAVEWVDGSKTYYVDDKRHRIDGPAVEWANGDKEYYIDGKPLTEEQFLTRTRVKELSIADIEQLLGYSVKVVK